MSEFFNTDNPEIAEEFAKRVVGGALKAARSFVPTYENMEGKRVHHTVAIENGVLYVSPRQAAYIAQVRLKFDEMCKKRGPLRALMAEHGPQICTVLNYGLASPWLKAQDKNVRHASAGPNGISIAVALGIVELELRPTQESRQLAEEVNGILQQRVLHREPIVANLPLPQYPETGDSWVLRISNNEAVYASRFVKECEDTQLLLKSGMMPAGEITVSVYEDELGGRVVRLNADALLYEADIFYRVLQV